MKGFETVLARANTRSSSLRTTVPQLLTRQFDLEPGDKLVWELLPDGDGFKIVVSPVKK